MNSSNCDNDNFIGSIICDFIWSSDRSKKVIIFIDFSLKNWQRCLLVLYFGGRGDRGGYGLKVSVNQYMMWFRSVFGIPLITLAIVAICNQSVRSPNYHRVRMTATNPNSLRCWSASYTASYMRTIIKWSLRGYTVAVRVYFVISTFLFAVTFMMTSSNGNIFRVTGHLCGEFIGHQWIPRTKASDADHWCFFWSAPE